MCLIPTGYTETECGMTMGGLLKLYLANKKQVLSYDQDPTDDTVTGVTLTDGAKFYEFEFEPTAGAGFDEPLTPGANTFVAQSISFNIKGINQKLKNILKKLATGKFVVIAQYPDGHYRIGGLTGKGLLPQTLRFTSGRVETDLMGAELVLTGNEVDYSNEITAEAVASLI